MTISINWEKIFREWLMTWIKTSDKPESKSVIMHKHLRREMSLYKSKSEGLNKIS